MIETIEQLCAALALVGMDADALADLENELRYLAGLLRGAEVRE